MVGSLQDSSGYVGMNGVLHLVGSVHLGVVSVRDFVMIGIAKSVLDRTPYLAARNGIAIFVGFAERRQSKSKRHQSHNHESRLYHGVPPRTMCFF
jgi:hypothetical protein